MYQKYLKRILDFILSLTALILLSPIMLILAMTGWIMLRGNPFFFQKRPGKDGKIFRMVKFRTMSNARDGHGNLLPDEKRMIPYGAFLRKTSLDEIPELFNIVKGDMAIVGPRPLLVKYLPLYTEEQARRHEVRPGLTGLAQVHGRNAISWEERFSWDVRYVDNVSFRGDFRILLQTVMTVLKRDGISSGSSVTMEEFTGSQEKK